jgi:hypothetical protein
MRHKPQNGNENPNDIYQPNEKLLYQNQFMFFLSNPFICNGAENK